MHGRGRDFLDGHGFFRRHHHDHPFGGEDVCAAGRGGHRGSGPPGFGPPGFGPPRGPGSPWDFFRRCFHRGMPRARRGDIRAAILALLAEGPRNGYQIIQELEQRSQGAWKPSPGSIYPALQLLEDEGLIGAEAKLYTLTKAGRKYVEEHKSETRAPWEDMAGAAGDDAMELMSLIREAGAAAMQVAHHGHAAQMAAARKVLSEARRALYRILAEDGGDGDS